MPLLPGGDGDLQRAIYDAVESELLRLVGADDGDRHVTGASEIGVGQTSLRLAKPSSETSTDQQENTDDAEDEDEGGGDSQDDSETGDTGGKGESAAEKQVAFALRSSLTGESRDAVYRLLQELADKVDAGHVTYAEVMVKMRMPDSGAQAVAKLVSDAGASPDVRDV